MPIFYVFLQVYGRLLPPFKFYGADFQQGYIYYQVLKYSRFFTSPRYGLFVISRKSHKDIRGIMPTHIQMLLIYQYDFIIMNSSDFVQCNDTTLIAFHKSIRGQLFEFLIQCTIFLIDSMLCMYGYIMFQNFQIVDIRDFEP